MILPAVLLVITLAALAGTAALVLAEAQLESGKRSLGATRARALAWSGVQAAMTELLGQRDALLAGSPPKLTASWELFAEGGRKGVVRTRLSGADPDAPVGEAGKLNINTATAEMLGGLAGVGPELAARIVAARGAGPFGSVESLLGVEGVTPEMLYGAEDAEDGAGRKPAASRKEEGIEAGGTPAPRAGEDGKKKGEAKKETLPPAPSLGEGELRRADSTSALSPGRLIDVLTASGFDPNIQAGMGRDAGESRGKRRVNLNVEWSDRLERAIGDRFGGGTGPANERPIIVSMLEQMIKSADQLKSESAMVAKMRALGAPASMWGGALDAFTGRTDPFIAGRVDLSSAPAAVLACVRGIDAAAADRIVRERPQLGDEERVSVTWPVVREILTADEFEKAVDHLTARSMQWRVIVEAGFEADDGGAMAADSSRRAHRDGSSRRPDAGPLRDRIVLEAIIDVASERPRVAYLRDVTLLPLAVNAWAEHAARVGGGRPGASAAVRATTAATTGGASGAPTGPTGSAASGSRPADAAPPPLPTPPVTPTKDSSPPSSASDSAGRRGPGAEVDSTGDAEPDGGTDTRTGRWTPGAKAAPRASGRGMPAGLSRWSSFYRTLFVELKRGMRHGASGTSSGAVRRSKGGEA